MYSNKNFVKYFILCLSFIPLVASCTKNPENDKNKIISSIALLIKTLTETTGILPLDTATSLKYTVGSSLCRLKLKNKAHDHIGVMRLEYCKKFATLWIKYLDIEKQFQCKGWGTLLVNTAIAIAKELAKKESIALSVVPASPSAASQDRLENYYKSFGFIPDNNTIGSFTLKINKN